MKTLVISTTFILAIASLVPAAYGKVDGSNTKVCQSIPPAKPTGGATRERLQAMQQCNIGVQQFTRKSNTGVCQSMPPATPTGGGNRERLQAMRRCNTGVR